MPDAPHACTPATPSSGSPPASRAAPPESSAVPRAACAAPLASRAAFLSLAAAGLLLLALTVQNIWGIDLWWQIRTGQWILDHRAVPSHDTLSYSAADHPWIEMRWLYCVLAYLGYRAGGTPLLILAQSALLLATFAVIVWPLRRTATTLPGILILFLGIVTASQRFVVRPELFTFLLICVFLVILDRDRRIGRSRWLWALPALQVVWTNSHTLFIFGPLLAWMFAGDATLRMVWQRRAAKRSPPITSSVGVLQSSRTLYRRVAVALLTTAACWINPYGHAGATFPFLLFREIHKGSLLGRTILEFRSPLDMDRWNWPLHVSAVFVFVSAATFLLRPRRIDPMRLALWSAMLYLAATAERNVGLFGFVATWLALCNWHDFLAARAARPSSSANPRGRASAAAHAVAAALLLIGTWFVVTDRYYRAAGLSQEFGLGVLGWETPDQAVRFLLEASPKPQVFHGMADGAYLTWAARGRYPVFIDGRLEVYGEDFIGGYLHSYLDLISGFGDWDGFADQLGVNVAMLHREHLVRLIGRLRVSPRWTLVHLDAREVIFVRNIPEHADLIRKYRIDLWRPWTPREPEPRETPEGWRAAIGAVGWPWHSMGMAQTFLLLGSPRNAEAYVERAVAAFPKDESARFHLAALRRLRGRDAEADALLAEFPPTPTFRAQLELLLSNLLESERRWPEAIAAVERARILVPTSAGLHARLGELLLNDRQAARAAAAFRDAVKHAPRNAFHWFALAQACQSAGDDAGAIEAYRQTVKFGAGLYQAQYNLGVLLVCRGDKAGARACFEAALRASPGHAAARRALDGLD